MNRTQISVLQPKRYVLVLLLFLAPNFASAQNDLIYEVQSSLMRGAIVRQWKDNLFVTYNFENPVNHFFSIINTTDGSAISFHVTNLKVYDMEIEMDRVYFCGEDTNGAMMGYFDIPTLFSSGAGMEVISLNGVYQSQSDTN